MMRRLEVDFQRVIKLVMITIKPTTTNIVFKGILPTSFAAIGAATMPPRISPAISANGIFLRKIKKSKSNF